MSRLAGLLIMVAATSMVSTVQAGDSRYRFHVSLLNHINDIANIPGVGPIPPSYIQTGTGPVGDVVSGRLSAVINVNKEALAALVNVNKPTRNDDLAGFSIGITFNDSGLVGVDISPKPIGNVDTLHGTGDKNGAFSANFQGHLINNGKKFRLYASNLNLQQILNIPAPIQAGVAAGVTEVRIKITASGTDPETGNAIKVTLSDELVTFDYVVNTRQDTADIDNDQDTTEFSFSMAVGKGTGKPK
jgi:hypothetical protein